MRALTHTPAAWAVGRAGFWFHKRTTYLALLAYRKVP